MSGFARLVAALVVLALLLPVALILYTTTDDFRSRLLERLVPELDGRMAGELSIGNLEGSPIRALRFEDVALAWHGETIARIDAVSIALDWPAMLAGRLQIEAIDLEHPRLLFKEHPALGWDWRDALAPLVPAPHAPRPPRAEPVALVIERLSLSNAAVRIEPRDRPAIELEGIDLRALVDLGERRIAALQASLATGDSKLVATGGLAFDGRADFEVAIESLAPRDLARVSPAVSESLSFLAPAKGGLVLHVEPEKIAAQGELHWPEARLTFDAHGTPRHLALSASTLTARLEVRELARFLPDAPLSGGLEADVSLVRGAGTIRAVLRPDRAGELSADGVVSLAEVPEAKLRFAARSLDVARAWRGHPEWAGSLTGSGTLDLRGRRREELAGAVEATLEGSRVGELEIRRGVLRAKLAGKTIELAELDVESPIGRARARGRLSTDRSAPVSLRGELDVEDLGPLLALARRDGAGTLHARLSLEGRVEKASLASEVEVSHLRLERFAVEGARLAFAARGRLAPGIDAVVESARIETVIGAWKLERPSRLRVSGGALEIDSARFSSGEPHVVLDGRLGRSGEQAFRLEAHALPVAEWLSRFPDRVPPDFLSRGELDLDLAVGGTAVAPVLDVRLAPRDLVLSDKPIERAEATLHYAPRMAHATLSVAAAPALRLDAEARLPFELRWAGELVARPIGELAARADCEASDLAIVEPFVSEYVEKLAGRARCHLELAGPLDALRPSGELELSGLTGRPRRSGVTVVDGELAVELAADRFRLRRASATAAGHEDTARFRADGEGPLPAFLARFVPSGKANAGDYTTKVEVERWPLVETSRDRLIASGVLTARGSLEAPHVEGKVEIVEGTLRPNLTFLSSGPPPRDATIEFEQDASTAEGSTANGGPGEAAAGPSLLSSFEALELSVDVDVGRDLWIKHEQAEVLLSGRVEARKQRGKPLSLEGRIEAQRGFADLQNRRFRLIEGSLELTGGAKIDPTLDVLGRYKAPAHVIDARLTGTASRPVLTLTADPELSQEDILAVLLFGRPAGELSQQQQTSLGQRAEQMASSLGITAVGRSLASAIGLEALGVQIEELSSQRASLGAYVGRNIFVALSQDFAGERGQELSIEYEFWPGWSVVGSTTSMGTNSADLVWKVRY